MPQNSRILSAEWAGALSWWQNQSPFLHISCLCDGRLPSETRQKFNVVSLIHCVAFSHASTSSLLLKHRFSRNKVPILSIHGPPVDGKGCPRRSSSSKGCWPLLKNSCLLKTCCMLYSSITLSCVKHSKSFSNSFLYLLKNFIASHCSFRKFILKMRQTKKTHFTKNGITNTQMNRSANGKRCDNQEICASLAALIKFSCNQQETLTASSPRTFWTALVQHYLHMNRLLMTIYPCVLYIKLYIIRWYKFSF